MATERENAVSSPNLSETCCQPPHPLTPHPTCWGHIRCEVHLREPSVVGGGRRWGAEGESFSGWKRCNFPVSRHWGPVPRPSPPLLRRPPRRRPPLPPPESPPRWNFTAKPGVGEGRGEGPSAGSGDWRTRHPDFVLRVGEPRRRPPASSPPRNSGCRLHWRCRGDPEGLAFE